MEQQSLFGNRAGQDMPLATRMRPRTLEEFAGQRHLLGKGKVLRQLIEEDRVSSMIFWGPPGVGKTTLAQIIAARTKANFINFSAVTSGIKEIRGVMSEAEQNHRMGERTLLFSTKSIALIRRSRTRFCRLWKRAVSCLSVRPRRTPRLR